jgi:hypothetical protein
MWALLLTIVMPGKRDKVVWCQIKVCVMFRVIFGSIWLLYMLYSKLFGWVIEGKIYATAGGERGFLVIVPW